MCWHGHWWTPFAEPCKPSSTLGQTTIHNLLNFIGRGPLGDCPLCRSFHKKRHTLKILSPKSVCGAIQPRKLEDYYYPGTLDPVWRIPSFFYILLWYPTFAMGNTSSSPIQKCLQSAVGKDVAFPTNNPLFQLTDVKPYNLGVPSTPAAVTYPRTADQVAQIVKCAVDSSLKVQARSGGHSYANYG